MSNRSEAKLTGQFEEYRGSVYQQNLQCFISIYHAYRHLMWNMAVMGDMYLDVREWVRYINRRGCDCEYNKEILCTDLPSSELYLL